MDHHNEKTPKILEKAAASLLDFKALVVGENCLTSLAVCGALQKQVSTCWLTATNKL